VEDGSLVLWVASTTDLSENKAESRQQITGIKQKTADKRQQTVNSRQQTTNNITTDL
jgi:hypothetical protein